MASVFILHHIHELPGGADEVIFIGVFSSHPAATEAVAQLSAQPGFRAYPKIIDPLDQDESESGFYIDEYTIDEIHWKEGYISWAESETTEEEEPAGDRS